MQSATALNEMVVSLALPAITFEGNSKLALERLEGKGNRKGHKDGWPVPWSASLFQKDCIPE